MFEHMMESDEPLVSFNTGTLYDMMVGSYMLGTDGKWYLNGGLGTYTTATAGRENTFKSTIIDSLEVSVQRLYEDIFNFSIDTEASKSKSRIVQFCDTILHTRADGSSVDVSKRIALKNGPKWSTDEVFRFIKKEITPTRNGGKKSGYIDSPFENPETGLPIKTWIPVIVAIDSYSELRSEAEAALLDKESIGGKKTQTLYLVDGNKKTIFNRDASTSAGELGISFCLVAQVGDNMSLESYGPVAKEMPHMRQKDKLKNVGSKFLYLTHSVIQPISARPCHDSSKQALYKNGVTSPTDLMQVTASHLRNKLGKSGQIMDFIISQTSGLLPRVTELHYLRETCKYAGLDGGPSAKQHACVLYPGVSFTRNTFRGKVREDYRLARAVELAARYLFIQNNWNLSSLPFDFEIPLERVYDKIMESKDLTIDRVLDSTSYWSYADRGREILTWFEIMKLLGLQRS